MASFVILKNLKGGEKFPGELPKWEGLSIGDYVVFENHGGDERIGVVSVPAFTSDEETVTREWGKPNRVVAILYRHEMDWPEPDVMDVTLPEIDG